VELPNGRKIKLLSKKGADQFVQAVGTDFFSMNLTATNDAELTVAYAIMRIIIRNASPEKVATGFPESELRTFVEHTLDTLATLSIDHNWIRSGLVSKCHTFLLKAVASFTVHPSFVKIFLSNGGMEAVAKCYASRKKNDAPDNCVSQLILTLVTNTLCDLTQENPSYEKAFGTIEKTGLLGQFIRCASVDPECSVNIVKRLQTCLQLVKKKCKSGTRTGDILNAVIAGKDGHVDDEAKYSLVRLQSLAQYSNSDYDCSVIKKCNRCVKIETQIDSTLLMKCQRCKAVYYCSKECQIADWKYHKKTCKVISSGNASRSSIKTAHNTASAFIPSNYFDIAKEVYRKTQECNVPKTELLVEIDFYGDAPALRNEFKVWLTSDYSVAPDWFGIGTCTEKKTLERFLREGYETLTSDDLLVVCRAGNCMVSITRMFLPGAKTGCQLLSDEAVKAVGTENYDWMVVNLGQDTTDEYFKEKEDEVSQHCERLASV
jgi:hypothetical protein